MALWMSERKGEKRERKRAEVGKARAEASKRQRVKKMELKSSMKKMPMEFQQRSTERAIKTKM